MGGFDEEGPQMEDGQEGASDRSVKPQEKDAKNDRARLLLITLYINLKSLKCLPKLH